MFTASFKRLLLVAQSIILPVSIPAQKTVLLSVTLHRFITVLQAARRRLMLLLAPGSVTAPHLRNVSLIIGCLVFRPAGFN